MFVAMQAQSKHRENIYKELRFFCCELKIRKPDPQFSSEIIKTLLTLLHTSDASGDARNFTF